MCMYTLRNVNGIKSYQYLILRGNRGAYIFAFACLNGLFSTFSIRGILSCLQKDRNPFWKIFILIYLFKVLGIWLLRSGKSIQDLSGDSLSLTILN